MISNKKTLPIPKNEEERLAALKSYNILDTVPETRFDNLTRLAAEICESSICVISLLDKDRQWFKSKQGIEADGTPRDISFCQYTIMDTGIFEIEDATRDERFKDNPLVTSEPNIRFYAGESLIDKDGHALGTLCVIDDKPKKLSKHQQSALRILADEVMSEIHRHKELEEKEKYEKFFKMSYDLMCIANLEGYFTKVSPAFTKLLGWSEEELLKKPYFDFIHPEDIEKTKLELADLSKGIPSNGFENRFLTNKNDYRCIHWTANPDSKTGEFYSVGHDVTELKKSTNKIEKKSAELESVLQFQKGILNGTNHSIISTDLNGIIKSFNRGAEKLTGYSADEIINQTSPAILHDISEVVAMSTKLSLEYNEKIEPGFDVFVYKARELKKADENLWTYIRKDGTRVPVNLSVTMLTNEKGEPTGYLGIASDYTEKQEFINEIQRKNKELDQFSYVVSHDLKAPLRGINNLASWIKEDIKTDDEEIHNNLNLMQGRVLRMENLINGILQYSKVGRVNIEPEPVDLNQIISGVIDSLPIPDHFEIKISNIHPIIPLRKILWEQVYANLISNAIKYIDHEKGIITLSSEETETNFILKIMDNGPGIAKEFHERIFGMFQTLEARDKYESTGVGLAIVQKIIEEAKGSIKVESDGKTGSTFIITLPK